MISSTVAVCGTTSEYTWASRTRRAISCAYCAPKSTTTTGPLGLDTGISSGGWLVPSIVPGELGHPVLSPTHDPYRWGMDTITPEPRPAWIAGRPEQGESTFEVSHPFDGSEVATIS